MSQKKKNLLIHNNIQAFSLGLAPEQTEQALVTPSQKRVSQYKKIRKRIMREREAKVGKYNSPKGERKRKSLLNRRIRESKIGRHSRPLIKSPRGLESLSRIILLSCNI